MISNRGFILQAEGAQAVAFPTALVIEVTPALDTRTLYETGTFLELKNGYDSIIGSTSTHDNRALVIAPTV